MKLSFTQVHLNQRFQCLKALKVAKNQQANYFQQGKYEQKQQFAKLHQQYLSQYKANFSIKAISSVTTDLFQQRKDVDSVACYEGKNVADFLRRQNLSEDELLNQVQNYSQEIFSTAIQLSDKALEYKDKATEISLVLCDNDHIKHLNSEYRGKAEVTDVLSFPMDFSPDTETLNREVILEDFEDAVIGGNSNGTVIPGEEQQELQNSFEDSFYKEEEQEGGQNMMMLGDVVISLEQALEQAKERGHSLQMELQVLLTHGILHLMGYDHEKGENEKQLQASMENKIFQKLQWPVTGLVTSTDQISKMNQRSEGLFKSFRTKAVASRDVLTTKNGYRLDNTRERIKLIAIDLDGTLLSTKSEVLDSSIQVIKAALKKGIKVIIATGKCRTSAAGILKKHGLSGKGLVVDFDGPGIYINGAATFDKNGMMTPTESLPNQLTQSCFEYSDQNKISLVSFVGDNLVTQLMTPENLRVHTFYHEPLPIVKSIPQIIKGDPSKKLLFTGDPDFMKNKLRVDMKRYTRLHNAVIVQPMPHMLEILTKGMSKWKGAKSMLKTQGLKAENMMMFGDGENDIELLQNCGLGVAMANGQPEVLEAADYVTASNDDHGIALAFEKFIL